MEKISLVKGSNTQLAFNTKSAGEFGLMDVWGRLKVISTTTQKDEFVSFFKDKITEGREALNSPMKRFWEALQLTVQAKVVAVWNKIIDTAKAGLAKLGITKNLDETLQDIAEKHVMGEEPDVPPATTATA
jgi:hypothetical protein